MSVGGLHQASLFQLDVLPSKCGIEAQVRLDPGTSDVRYVRFRATRIRRFRGAEKSEWSGWFPYEGEPMVLRWDTFWVK